MSTVEKAESSNGSQVMHYYPAPLSTHDEVVKDYTVFWDTLKRFHLLMNTRFMIPVIGGKELDLHTLYVEVTNRGGFEKVVQEKKWREVSTPFNFSSTTTSASFVLRKHYSSQLYHYEQVHFFKRQAPQSSPPAVSPVAFSISNRNSSDSQKSELGLVEYSPDVLKRAKVAKDCLVPGTEGTGIINGKFDCGYLVSVKLGSEILTGVLYHPKEQDVSSPEPISALAPYAKSSRRRSSVKRKSRRREDPNHPKPNRSGYNFFFAEKHDKLKSLYPNRGEFTKMIGKSWKSLTAEERMVYDNIGIKDKERYQREMKVYREKKLGQTMEVKKETVLTSKAQETQ